MTQKTWWPQLFRRYAAVACLTTLGSATGMESQEAPYTDGLVVGVNTAAVSIRQGEHALGSDNGLLLGAMIGYGLTRYVTAFLSVDVGYVSPTGESGRMLGHADLGLRLLASRGGRAVPYGEVAFAGVGREFGDGSLLGNAFTAGAGVEVFSTPNSSIDVGFRYSRGEFDERRYSGGGGAVDPIRVSTKRIMIGYKRRPPRP